jgi:hypothetical protein
LQYRTVTFVGHPESESPDGSTIEQVIRIPMIAELTMLKRNRRYFKAHRPSNGFASAKLAIGENSRSFFLGQISIYRSRETGGRIVRTVPHVKQSGSASHLSGGRREDGGFGNGTLNEELAATTR